MHGSTPLPFGESSQSEFGPKASERSEGLGVGLLAWRAKFIAPPLAPPQEGGEGREGGRGVGTLLLKSMGTPLRNHALANTASTTHNPNRYLRAQDLRLLRSLKITPRFRVKGLFSGLHASLRSGRGVEFSDHRPYLPGDCPADVDWKVFARCDRMYVRSSQHEANAAVHLLLDGSASMDFRGFQPTAACESKFDHACRIAAAVSHLTLRQHDRLSLGIAQGGLKSYLPARGSADQLLAVLKALEETRPAGESGLALALRDLAAMNLRRGLLVILSDLLEDPDPILQSTAVFNAKGWEIWVMQLLHADEISPPALGRVRLVDLETQGELTADPADQRAGYPHRLGRWLEAWSAACRRQGINYALVNTAEPWIRAVQDFLACTHPRGI